MKPGQPVRITTNLVKLRTNAPSTDLIVSAGQLGIYIAPQPSPMVLIGILQPNGRTTLLRVHHHNIEAYHPLEILASAADD